MSDRITRDGDHLAGRIEENLLQSLAQLEHAAYGFESGHWDVEDPAETDQDENDWPVILVRKSDGQRYSVEAMVNVNPLPALVDVQQPSPIEVAVQTRKADWTPLQLDPWRACSKCDSPLVLRWVERDGDHADCGHLARMRASHPEWFADTANQTALPIADLASSRLLDGSETS